MEITMIVGREILDRSGNPTVEADLSPDHSDAAPDRQPEDGMEPASDGSAAEHGSEMKRVNLVLNEALYRDLERLCEECRTAEAKLEQISQKQQAAEEELENVREMLARQAGVIPGSSGWGAGGPDEGTNTERTIHRWIFGHIDIAPVMRSMRAVLLAQPLAATVCLIAILAFSAYESHEVLAFFLSVIRVLATLAVASIVVTELRLSGHTGWPGVARMT
jgi:hypothetical protein